MPKPIICITRPLPKPAHELLKKIGTVRYNKQDRVLPPNELKKFVRGATAILSIIPDRIDSDILDAAGHDLKIVANYAVGFDNIDLTATEDRHVIVTNTPGVLTEAVAEHTMSLLLATARRIVEADTFTRKGHYKQWEPMGFIGPQLWGKKLAIIGLGRIGSWVAEIARGGFGMQIIYYDITRNEEFEMRFQATYHELPTALRQADFITIHVPLLPSTKHLIGWPEFQVMQKHAILVNTSRGPVIDEQALVKALRTKQIFGAGIDVFEHEPKLSPGLSRLPNVVLTPHTASATVEAREAMSRIAAENIIAVLSGKAPLNPVQKKKD